MMKKHRFTTIALALILCLALQMAIAVPVAANAVQPVGLNTWTAESYLAVSSFPVGNWTVASDNMSVHQSQNGQPTLFYSDFNAFNTQVRGTINVSGSDDDYIGFALGFQPGDSTNTNADYLLIDWKKGTQPHNFGDPSCGPGSTAPVGLAVSRVNGIPTADEFWGHIDQDAACPSLGQALTELARGTNLGRTGWLTGPAYDLPFEFQATSVTF